MNNANNAKKKGIKKEGEELKETLLSTSTKYNKPAN